MISPSGLTYTGVASGVLANQLCLPVPAVVFLMGAGALAAHGYMHISTVVLLSVLACLAGDGIWFWLGRRWGSQAMKLLCRLTPDPRKCSRQAHEKFSRHGLPLLCVAKFLPGLDGLLPPLAGAEGASVPAFIALDALGSLVWSSFYVIVGYVFAGQLEIAVGWAKQAGTALIVLMLGPLAVYAGSKGFVLLRMIRRLQVRRIGPAMLHRKLSAGVRLVLLDLLDCEEDTGTEPSHAIPGAFRIDPVRLRNTQEIRVPADVGIVLYSSATHDMMSARVAVELKRVGIENVWVLDGGLRAWRESGLPLSACPERPEIVAERFGITLPAA